MIRLQTKSTVLTALLLISTAMTTTGCNGGGGSGGSSSLTDQNLNENIDLAKLDAELDSVEVSMHQLSSKMDALSILNLSSQGDGGKGLALQFEAIVDKILAGFQQVRAQVATLKVQFTDRLNQLDPNNPDHAQLIGRLEEALAYLDQVETFILEAKTRIVEKIDSIVAKVDALVAGVQGSNPIGIIVGIVWQTVKVEIIAARTELLN